MARWGCLIGLILFLCPPVWADDVYIWTDGAGVKHYSNEQPPEAVKDYQVVKGGITSSEPSEQQARQEYDQMMQQIRVENRRADQERRSRDALRKKALQQEEQTREQTRIKAERDRLQGKIDALNRRALSPTFSQGMRQAQIETIKEEMKRLDNASSQK